MAEEKPYPISQIQIGNKTFEIVDAVARDSVALIYKWGRPGQDVRFPNGGHPNPSGDGKPIIIAHILPNTEDYYAPHIKGDKYTDLEIVNHINNNKINYKDENGKQVPADGFSKWAVDWGYKSGFNINNVFTEENFSFCIGQLNVHSKGNYSRTIRIFITGNKYQTQDQEGKWVEGGDLTYDSGYLTYSGSLLPNNSAVPKWYWSTFYNPNPNTDLVNTGTFITSKISDLKGYFGLYSATGKTDGQVYDVYGNSTTVIFKNATVDYNNLIPDEIPEEESSNNDGS